MTPQVELISSPPFGDFTADPDVAEASALTLPDEDGVPLENVRHRLQINLLDDCLRQHWRDRTDFFAGGNMFVYYSLQPARKQDYKGPDFFVVKDMDGTMLRRAWGTRREGERRRKPPKPG